MIGFWLYVDQKKQDHSITSKGNEEAFLVEVSSVLSSTTYYRRYLAKLTLVRQQEDWHKENVLVLIREPLSRKEGYLPNDLVLLRGRIEPIPPSLNPFQFDYAKYLYYQHVHDQIRAKHSLKLRSGSSLRRMAFKMRSKLIDAFQNSAISGENAAILMAILLGDKSELETQLRTDFSRVGAMHILAVSGLHLGIIFLLFDQLLQLFRFRRQSWFRVILLTSILWGFALLTGMSNSVMRSALMFSFLIAADLLKRKGVGLNSVAASALILLLLDPFRLFQLGFQLSYLAVFGILTIYPALSVIFKSKYKLINKLIDLMLISLAAQLSTLPLTLAYFHQFPNLFLISNLLVVPLAFLIVSGGVLLSIIFLSSGSMWGLDHLINRLIDLLRNVVAYIAKFDWTATEGIWLQKMSLLFIALALLFLITYLHRRSSKYLITVAGLIAAILIVENLELILQSFQNQFTVYSNRAVNLISIKHGLSATLIQTDTSTAYDLKMVEDHLNAEQVRKKDTLKIFPSRLQNGRYPLLKYGEENFLIMEEYRPGDYGAFAGHFIVQKQSWKTIQPPQGVNLIVYSYGESLGSSGIHNLKDSLFQIRKSSFSW
jgi:competence protein ComEC